MLGYKRHPSKIILYFSILCFVVTPLLLFTPKAQSGPCATYKPLFTPTNPDCAICPIPTVPVLRPQTEIDWPKPIIKPCCPTNYECTWVQNFEDDVFRDFATYFTAHNLLQFGTVFVAAAIFANTGLDRTIRENFQEDFQSSNTQRFFKPWKTIGGLSYWYFPLYLGSMGIGYWRQCDPYGNAIYRWGYRNLRAMILGGIQVIILAPTLGSGRPSKREPSKWQPFKYVNGVSGHSFFGGLPFITAAMMVDPPLMKALLYVASTLPGLSRIDSDAHYFSQVLLGWSLAFFSARAVVESDMANPVFQASLIPKRDGVILYGRWKFD